MPEQLKQPTNIESYQNFLLENSLQEAQEIIDKGLLGPEDVEKRDLYDALGFMRDIELNHALWVDCIETDGGLSEDELASLREENRHSADLINFTMREIRLGNIALIQDLSLLEQRHEETDGLGGPFGAVAEWDGKVKWQPFLDLISAHLDDPVQGSLR